MRNFYHFFPANLIRNIHFHRSSKSFFISSEQKNIFNCKQYKKTYLFYISMYNQFWHMDWSVLICFNKIIEIPSSHDLGLKISVFTKVYFASHDVSRAHSWKPQGVDWSQYYIWSKPLLRSRRSLFLPSFSLPSMFAQKTSGKLLHAWSAA